MSAVIGEKKVEKMSNASTTETDPLKPIHPRENPVEDFIVGYGITQHKVAALIGVPPRRIHEVVYGKRGIIAGAAARPALNFGTSEELWIDLQSNDELRYEQRALRDQLEAIAPLRSA